MPDYTTDMDEVVTEAVEDAHASTGDSFDTAGDTSTDTQETAQGAAGEDASAAQTLASGQTDDQTQEDTETQVDEFSKRFGIPNQSVTGRENRIPYSRVKKIVEKAQKDEALRLTKEMETKFQPQLTEYQTKVQDYEGRLQKVAEFEQVMENDPQRMLGLLSQLPAYKPFFDWVNQLSSGAPQQDGQTGQTTQAPVSSGMPQPDVSLQDGSKVYSMEGLQKLLDWQGRQTKDTAVREAEERIAKRYAPIEQRWQQEERMAQVVPQIERQIADARKWDKFSDLEPRVIEFLKTDRNLSLEGAYIRAYQESVASERDKFTVDRNKMRSEILQEVKKRPTSTSVPGASARSTADQDGSESMDDLIRADLARRGLLK